MNTGSLKRYIEKVIDDATKSCGRENDVLYQAMIIDNNLLFAVKTKYKLVRLVIERRLLRNLTKNFGLSLHVIYPDPMKENYDAWMAAKFDIFESISTPDSHYSIMKWNVFGKDCLIRTFDFTSGYLNPIASKATSIGDYDGKTHLKMMKEHGYDFEKVYDRPCPYADSWETYCKAYEEAYGKPVMKAEDYETIRNF